MGRVLRDLGEENVISILAGRLLQAPSITENLGHPDDARDMLPKGPRIIYALDAFSIRSLKLPWRTMRDVGWMALTGAVSDVVAKGGIPSVAMIGLGLSGEMTAEDVEELASGVREAGDYYKVRVTGGDTNESRDPWIAVSVIGFTTCKKPPRRRGIKPGDVVVATGSYGAMGFVALHGLEEAGRREWVVRDTRRSTVRVELANVIMATYRYIHSSMDVSDGLGYTLSHISELNGYGITLKQLPHHPVELEDYCSGDTTCMWRHVLAGGEEYGVVLFVDGSRVDYVTRELDYYEISYSVIGVVEDRPPGVYINNSTIHVARWDQFKGWWNSEVDSRR
ncbi:MAG: thiamine-phosphate kinase [Desulfurococcus sp.]|nr:thiamine-phosphate kinase [Desulfurococcus sp.]